MQKLSLRLWAMFMTLGVLWNTAQAQAPIVVPTSTPTPVPLPLSSVQFDHVVPSWEAVAKTAKDQVDAGNPTFKSAPSAEQIPVYQSFIGTWTPTAKGQKLALLSDDGSTLTVDDRKLATIPEDEDENLMLHPQVLVGRRGALQGFENVGNCLSSADITGGFQKGHHYKIRIDYSNMIHVNAQDIDGATLFVYDGRPAKFAYLTGTAPDFVVYRNPNDPAPTPEPEPQIVASSGGDDNEIGSSNVNGDDSTSTEENAPAPVPEPTEEAMPVETAAPDIVPTPNEEVENPTISFGVHIRGFQGWKATVTVYSMNEGTGESGGALATYVTSDKTEVRWNELFPTSKPESGVYLYDVKVAGVEEAGQPLAGERTDGLSGDDDSEETQRLDTSLKISDLSWSILEDTSLVSPPTLNSPRLASTGTSSTGTSSTDTSDVTTLKIRFRLMREGVPIIDMPPYMAVISPQFERESPVDIKLQDDGFYQGTLALKMDSPLELGNFILVGGAQKGVKAAVGTKKNADNSAQVLDRAAGFEVEENNEDAWIPVTNPDARRRPEVFDHVTFRAFLKIKTIKGTDWYSDKSLTASQIALHEWIGGSTGIRTAPKTLRFGTLEKGLNLTFDWRKFDNEAVDQSNDGHAYLWYGFSKPVVAGSSSSLTRQAGLGVSWWGVKISYGKLTRNNSGRGASGRWTYLLPTDRVGGNQLFDATKPPRQNVVSTGLRGRKTQALWLPEPQVDGAWWGRICGRGVSRTQTFVPGDTFWEDNPGTSAATQGPFHSKILREAQGFLNTPYAWGGQSYGGKQSKTSDNYTYTSGSSKIDIATNVPDCLTKVGYGIDCNGFVSGAYHLACVSSPYGATDEGPNTSGLATTADAKPVADQFLVPGDYIVMPGSHVVYVRAAPTLEYNSVRRIWQVNQVNTIEADVSITSEGDRVLRGRTRYYSWSGDDLRGAHATNRRWLPR